MRDKLGRFIKGYHYNPKTEFKNGHTSWHKGKKWSIKVRKKMSQSSFWKGKFKEKAPNWKGGKIIDFCGYVWFYQPNHPLCEKKGYIKKSHLVMEKHIGRYLKSTEIVHHINNIKNDDRIKNLRLFKNNSEHAKFHQNLKHYSTIRTEAVEAHTKKTLNPLLQLFQDFPERSGAPLSIVTPVPP